MGPPSTGDHHAYLAGSLILVSKPEGTTGRYVVTLDGLSAVLGTKSKAMTNVPLLVDVACYGPGGGLVDSRFLVLLHS